MANITRKELKDGSITYRFRACVGRDAGGKQVWRTTTINSPGLTPKKEEKEVERLAGEWEKEEREAYATERQSIREFERKRKAGSVTLKEFVDMAWFPVHVQNGEASVNSVKFYEHTSRIVCDRMGNMKLEDITTYECAQFVSYLNNEAKTVHGEPYSKTSRMHIFGTLRNILRTAKRWKYIKYDPTEDLEGKERPHREKKPVEYLTIDEADKFLNALLKEPIKKRALFTLLIYEGMRRGEAVALTWADVNMEQMTITISKSAVIDKDQPTGRGIKGTKTGDTRVIPMRPEVCDVLKELKADQEKKYSVRLAPSAFVFCESGDPSICLYPSTPTRWMGQIVKKHHLKKCTVHELRRTCCSTLLHNGIDAKTVCAISGHRDTNTLYQYYSGTNGEQTKKALDTINYNAG